MTTMITVSATDAVGATATATVSPTQSTTSVTRNVFQQPFGINSIWNTPLGVGTGGLVSGGTGPHGGATFKYANSDGPVYEFAGHTVGNTLCDENLILLGPNSPSRPLFSSTSEWNSNPSAPARCSAAQTAVGISLPVPTNASYPGQSGGNPCTNAGVIGSQPNCSAAILESNRRTIYQTQPLQICVVGGTSSGSFTTGGSFPTFVSGINTVDIFADEVNLFTGTKPSAIGSHGGSWMSGLGGTIRYNEIVPGNCPIVPGVADVMRHVLAVGTWHIYNAFTSGFVWPAIHTDTGSDGLLLALLPTFNINSLLTAPGRSLAWTAMNYGIYNNDDSAWDAVNLETEYSYGDSSVNCPTGRTACQFQTLWGFTMMPEPNTNNNWGKDIVTIFQNLYVITNNTSSTIGGPGAARMQPLTIDPIDSGVITVAPSVTNNSFTYGHTGSAGQFIGQVSASNSPFLWSLAGTGSANFWVQPTTGLIYAAVSGIATGTYTLTATATNIVGSGTGTVTITVN